MLIYHLLVVYDVSKSKQTVKYGDYDRISGITELLPTEMNDKAWISLVTESGS